MPDDKDMKRHELNKNLKFKKKKHFLRKLEKGKKRGKG